MAVGVLDPRKGIIWQGNESQLPPDVIEQLQALEARKRMGGVDTSPVGDWTQGAARVVDALGGVLRERRLNNAATENQSYNSDLVNNLLGTASPAASTVTAEPSVSQEMSATSPAPNVSPDIRNGIVETASALGINPVDLGTAISYETGGTFDPVKAGPTTQWGQHKGLIQFGEPQAKQYGVDWNNPVGSQLGANGAVANYLRSTGVKPGMGLMDIYSAINAGGVGRYGASDANNGGAPGTVADKVNQQMSDHRAKAMALLGDYGNAGNPEAAAAYSKNLGTPFQPAQAAIAAQAPASGYVDPTVSSQPDAPALPAPTTIANAPPVAAVQPQQVAQAPQASPTAIAQALRVMADPRANQGTRAVANALIQQEQQRQQAMQEQQTWMQRQQYEQQQQANDPLRKLQIQEAQIKVGSANRQPLINAGSGAIYDPNTQSWLKAPGQGAQFRQAAPEEAAKYGVSGGQFGPDGRFYPVNPPSGMAVSVGPDGQVSVSQGPGVKPLTESQSKDSFFTTRMSAATPTLDKFESALMSAPEAVADYLPGGRYVQSEEYQLAKDAGRDFVNAYLRKDSGAALTTEEERNYGQLLLPQPGDKPAILAAKRQRRAVAMEAIKSGMPSNAVDGALRAIQAVPGANQPAQTTNEKKTSSGVQWSIED